MKMIGHVLLGSLFLLIMAVTPTVHAFPIPIPVGTTPSDDLILNFDFTSSTPPPPYASWDMRADFAGGGSPFDVIIMDIFGGLNGTGGLVTPSPPLVVGADADALILTNFTTPELLDGLFSVGFRLISGTAILTGLTATEHTAAGLSVTISGVPAVVPEPATLALLGVGLTGLGLARRRSRRLQSTAV